MRTRVFRKEGGMLEDVKKYWVYCPVCKNKTRIQVRADTELKNFPLYCPKCKHETLINEKELNIEIVIEPDAQTQSR